MSGIDFKKDPGYKAKRTPEIVDIPPMIFVMVDGAGAPEGSQDASTEFQEAMQALFGIVYTIKFWAKQHAVPAGYEKFGVAPVEALWWSSGDQPFTQAAVGDWRWTAMLRLPEFVTQEFFDEVVAECVTKKHSDVFRRARLEPFTEGTCVQVLHIGPYDQEMPTIEAMHSFARDRGYQLVGKHHELYFGDPRRTAPDKLRTILRQPVTPRE